jgi:hypothetical protein
VLNRTQLAFAFQNNEEDDAPLFGPMFAGATTVYVGYVEVDDGLQVLMVCPDGQREAWHMIIEPSGAEIVPLPTKATPDEELLVEVVTPAEKETKGENE